MTFRELREKTRPIADQLAALAVEAEADEFAPWVVVSLEQAAFYARLSEAALNAAAAEPVAPRPRRLSFHPRSHR